MNCWLSVLLRTTESGRPNASTPPPGANGLTIVTGLVGHCCACTRALMSAIAAPANSFRLIFIPLLLPYGYWARIIAAPAVNWLRITAKFQRGGGSMVSFRHAAIAAALSAAFTFNAFAQQTATLRASHQFPGGRGDVRDEMVQIIARDAKAANVGLEVQ